MNPARKYLAVIGLVSVLLLAYGCASTLSLVTVPATAVNLGTMAYQSIENAQILIRMRELPFSWAGRAASNPTGESGISRRLSEIISRCGW
ncbi:MAG: hypothetical protein JRE40_15720 [Deltaproteobacteria bacterium]|nr:hypothetical protein [Deltaproteobacteria bacterium]